MKKKSLVLGIACCFYSTLVAQDIKEINYINPSKIIGVYDLGMQSAVLCSEGNRSIDKKDLYSLRFLNTVDPIQEIAVEQSSRFFASESCETTNLLIFNNSEDISLVYIKPNSLPKEVKIPTLNEYRFHQAIQSNLSKTGVLTIIRSYTKYSYDRNDRDSVVELGTEYLTISNEGEVTNRRYDPYVKDEPGFGIVGIYSTSAGMVYLMEHSSRSKKEYQLRMDICDTEGNLTGSYILSSAQTHFPSEVVAKNGNIFVSGYYLNGNIYTSKKTEGMFTTILNGNGSVVSSNLYNWDNLKTKLRDTKRAEFIFNGKMNVLVENVIPTATGYRIICESYSSGSGTTTAEFLLGGNSSDEYVITVHDFIIFETNASGEIVNINILEKEVSNIEVGGRAKRLPVLQLVSMLKKYSIFPYKGVNGDVINFIQYKNNVGFYAEMNVLSGEISEGTPILLEPVIEEEVDKDYEKLKANNNTVNKLDKFSQKMNKFEKKVDDVGNKMVYSLEKIDRSFNPYERSSSGLFFLDDNKVISYIINDKTYTLYYGFIN